MADSEQDRQIVVASDQMRLVRPELGDRTVLEERANPRLGLTLLPFGDIDAVGDRLTRRRTAEPSDAEPPPQTRPQTRPQTTPPATGVDRLLGELRALFEHRYAGWSPTLGKNRTLSGVQFEPYTHGGFDKPTPTGPQAPPAAAAPLPTRRVRVGLFDTRLAPHSRLTGRYLTGDGALIAPVPAGRQRQWWEGHSTFIAGIIERLAPTVVLDVRTALRPAAPDGADSGSAADRNWTMPLWDFAARLGDYQDAGVSVINLSVGLATVDNKPPLVLERAIAQLTPDVVVVAAAGNPGSAPLSDEQRRRERMPDRGAALFPAALDNVLAVGAWDGEVPAEFNPVDHHTGGVAPWIDVLAPGVEITSTYLGESGGEKVLVRDSAGVEETVEFSGWASWSARP